jgi:sulfite reductase (NADPH) flavoprotein alpha-component
MEVNKLKIVFATETGNSEDLANRTAEAAESKGFTVEVSNVEDVTLDDLQGESALVFIGSTMGEGEPPESAWSFHDAISEAEGTPLSSLNIAVVALGDTSYGDLFCAFGKKVEKELLRLGAKKIIDRIDCDVDFEGKYAGWAKQLFATITPA